MVNKDSFYKIACEFLSWAKAHGLSLRDAGMLLRVSANLLVFIGKRQRKPSPELVARMVFILERDQTCSHQDD